jgi:hypothetical protein
MVYKCFGLMLPNTELRRIIMSEVIKVTFTQAHKPETELTEALIALVYSYHGKMSVASALGCLLVAKNDLEYELLN